MQLSIEKFTGTFSKESLGVTILPTETIQLIKNAEVGMTWVYLASRPSNWQINSTEICNHFNFGIQKIRSILKQLERLGLLEVTRPRVNNKYGRNHYHLNLTPVNIDLEQGVKIQRIEKQTIENNLHTKHRTKQSIEKTNNISKEKKDFNNDEVSLCDAKPKELTETKKKKTKALDLVENNNLHNLPIELIQDFIEVRKAKRAPLTKTAVKQLNKELSKCVSLGINPIEALELAVSNGWTTVKADWISKNNASKTGRPDVNSHGWSKRNPEDIF